MLNLKNYTMYSIGLSNKADEHFLAGADHRRLILKPRRHGFGNCKKGQSPSSMASFLGYPIFLGKKRKATV